jgi:ABC-type oligopeptide transport system substrate-binding subunit
MLNVKQHRFLRMVVLFGLLLGLLAACVPAAAPAQPESTGEEVTAVEGEGRALPADAAEDQTLRYVTRGFSRLDPAAEGGFGRFVISHLWMPFFIRDNEGNVSPWLAEGYDVSEDGTVFTIHIHPDAVWSDGTPVTAQEAIDYWTYGLDPERCIGCYLAIFAGFAIIEGAQAVIDGESEVVSGLTAIDEKTLEVQLTGADPIFIDRLALFNTGFAKMEDVEKGEMWAADGSARVNGPFMVEKWDVDTDEYAIVRNPNWWGETQPYLERITAVEAADENVSFIMWQNDEVDAVQWLTNIREQLRPTDPDTFYQIPYATNFFYDLWTTIPPMDDPMVRRALLHAVDWNAAVTAAWEGARNDRVMTSFLTPELQCYTEGNWPDFGYDPELAREELAASTYGSAENLPKIRITTNGQSPNYIRTAEIMVEMWNNNLGITDAEIRPGPIDAWGQEEDQVQVRRSSAGAILPDSVAFLDSHYRRAINPTAIGLVDEELGTLLDELMVTPRDAEGFCAGVQEAEARLLEHHFILPMIWDLYEYNAKPWVKNFETNVDNNWASLLDVYIAEH